MRVFYDVDTQHDFMDEDGALYVPGAEAIKPALEKVALYANEQGIPVVGSVDRHFGTPEYKEREGELSRWGGPFPDHCMDGTRGWEKIEETAPRGNYVSIPTSLDDTVNEKEVNAAVQRCRAGEAVYFEKQAFDVTTNPAFSRFFERAGIEEAVVYGVATDYCVKDSVLGMQEMGVQCYVVEEATSGIQQETVGSARQEIYDAGARFVSLDEVIGS